MLKKRDVNNDNELRDKLRRKSYSIGEGVVAILIKFGLDVNKPDEYEHAFLYNALQRGDKDLTMAKRLIDRKGADLHVKAKKGAYLHALLENEMFTERLNDRNLDVMLSYIKTLHSKGLHLKKKNMRRL